MLKTKSKLVSNTNGVAPNAEVKPPELQHEVITKNKHENRIAEKRCSTLNTTHSPGPVQLSNIYHTGYGLNKNDPERTSIKIGVMKKTKTDKKGFFKYHLKTNKGSLCDYRIMLTQEAPSTLIYLKKHMLRSNGVYLWSEPMLQNVLTCPAPGKWYVRANDYYYIFHSTDQAKNYKHSTL
jgi:hypothetical protein